MRILRLEVVVERSAYSGIAISRGHAAMRRLRGWEPLSTDVILCGHDIFGRPTRGLTRVFIYHELRVGMGYVNLAVN